jgi:undecaprenyl-phosphate 4-deoxy-4-formamido-L-arabinose transferase
MNPNNSISVLIPVYRSEATLSALVKRLAGVLGAMQADYELILVNDGSPDRSWEIICGLAKDNPFIQGINLTRNYGQHNALLCGIRAARKDIIVTMDADLQNPPEEISRLLAKLDEGYDVVYGVPQKKQHGPARRLASWMVRTTLKSALNVESAFQGSSFRAFRTQLRSAFESFNGPAVSLDVLLTWGSTRICSIPVRHEANPEGRSSYSFLKLFSHCFDVMTGFSSMPLHIASLTGFLFTIFGLGVLVYVVGRYLILGYSVPGFPFLASIIAIFAGAQLFALGIMGAYLARIHFRIMNRPTYVVRETINEESDKAGKSVVSGQKSE